MAREAPDRQDAHPVSRRALIGFLGAAAAVAPGIAWAQAPRSGPAEPPSTVTTPPRDFGPTAPPNVYSTDPEA